MFICHGCRKQIDGKPEEFYHGHPVCLRCAENLNVDLDEGKLPQPKNALKKTPQINHFAGHHRQDSPFKHEPYMTHELMVGEGKKKKGIKLSALHDPAQKTDLDQRIQWYFNAVKLMPSMTNTDIYWRDYKTGSL